MSGNEHAAPPAPQAMLEAGDWAGIEALARDATALERGAAAGGGQ